MPRGAGRLPSSEPNFSCFAGTIAVPASPLQLRHLVEEVNINGWHPPLGLCYSDALQNLP